MPNFVSDSLNVHERPTLTGKKERKKCFTEYTFYKSAEATVEVSYSLVLEWTSPSCWQGLGVNNYNQMAKKGYYLFFRDLLVLIFILLYVSGLQELAVGSSMSTAD